MREERRLSAGILSGGESSRMGQDKALVRIDNERIIDRLKRELGGLGEVIISAGQKNTYDDMGLPIVYDENAGIGPIEGIRQVIAAATEDYVFICAADMPFITRELIDYMAGYICSDYDCYVIADDEHIHPLCGIYSKKVLPVIEELISEGRYRLREILNRVRTKYISLEHTDFDRKIVKNINTRAELREAAKPLVFCVSGYSNSGKTGLIEKLINEFIKDGLSVGVIKHDGHDTISDVPGSDSERVRKAGATAVAVFSDTGYLMYNRERTDAGRLLAVMESVAAAPDVVIIEGMKSSAYPKVEIVREEICSESVCEPSSLICIATDCISPKSVCCPVYGLTDVREIFLCIKDYFDI